jgi:hypothetical protein
MVVWSGVEWSGLEWAQPSPLCLQCLLSVQSHQNSKFIQIPLTPSADKPAHMFIHSPPHSAGGSFGCHEVHVTILQSKRGTQAGLEFESIFPGNSFQQETAKQQWFVQRNEISRPLSC